MRFRHAFPSLAFSLLVTLAPARVLAAPAVPDSLPQLRALMSGSRAGDPALPALAERIVARREAARRAKPADVAEALEHLGRVRLGRAEYATDSILPPRGAAPPRREPSLRHARARGRHAAFGEAQRVEK